MKCLHLANQLPLAYLLYFRILNQFVRFSPRISNVRVTDSIRRLIYGSQNSTISCGHVTSCDDFFWIATGSSADSMRQTSWCAMLTRDQFSWRTRLSNCAGPESWKWPSPAECLEFIAFWSGTTASSLVVSLRRFEENNQIYSAVDSIFVNEIFSLNSFWTSAVNSRFTGTWEWTFDFLRPVWNMKSVPDNSCLGENWWDLWGGVTAPVISLPELTSGCAPGTVRPLNKFEILDWENLKEFSFDPAQVIGIFAWK